MKRLVTYALTAGLLLSCTSCTQEENTGAGYFFTCTLSGNPECLDPQYTRNENAQTVLVNIMEGLLRLDANGNILLAGAESYTISDDGLTYTFTLKNDCYWYSAGMESKDAKPVTSLDYVYAFQRLLDPATNSPHAEDFLCLQNASAILNGTMQPDKLGVSAPDGATVIFHLEAPETNFPLLLTQCCAFPCNEDFFLSTKGRYGLDDQTILCNGAFYLTSWVYDAYGSGNFLTFRKNSMYHDADAVYPSSLQFTIMRSQTETDEDFADGNSDCIMTNQYPVNYLDSKNYTVRTTTLKTWGLIFNPENALLQNDALRQALAYGIDRDAFTDHLHENLQPAYGIIPPAVQLLGRSYRELYADEPLAIPYEPVTSAALFEKFAQTASLQSLNTLKVLVPESLSDTEALLTMCQEWQNLSGYYIGIETVSDTEYLTRLETGDYSIAVYNPAICFDDCYAALSVFSENADMLGFHSTDFDTIMKTLANTEQLSDRIALYGEAEKIIIDSCCFIPLFYQSTYLVYTASNTDIWYDPFQNYICFREAKHFS